MLDTYQPVSVQAVLLVQVKARVRVQAPVIITVIDTPLWFLKSNYYCHNGIYFDLFGVVMALNDEDKYKKPEWTGIDTAKVGGIATVAAGKGNPLIGAKNIASTAWDTTKAVGRVGQGMYNTAGGVSGIAKGARALGGVAGRALPAVGGLIANAGTDSEDYYERFGMNPYDDSRGALSHFGVRALGFASDVGNALTLGLAGDHLFQDKIRKNNEALASQTSQPQTTPQPTGENKRTYYGYDKPAQNAQTQTSQPQVAQSASRLNPPTATTYQAPSRFQGGLPSTNPNYGELVKQVENSQKQLLDNQEPKLGLKAFIPQRTWQEQEQRKELLSQATTPIKGARGLTANQMRLAHELTQDDVKLAQERYLQQNNLNHQLLQEQLQQEGQNARTLANEQGQNARFGANLGLDAQKFAQNLNLDVAKFNQDSQNSQYELGLKGADLRARLNSQAMDDKAKAEKINLYNQYVNAKTDSERDKILTQIAVLTGQGGGAKADSFATMNLGEQYDPQTQATINRGQALYNTRTGQIIGEQA